MTRKIVQGLLASSMALSLNAIAYADELVDVDVVSEGVTASVTLEVMDSEQPLILGQKETVDTDETVEESEDSTSEELDITEEIVEETVEEMADVEEITPSIAKVSTSLFEVNGEEIPFSAYTVDGFTYVKITDVAHALSGTASCFDIVWNRQLDGFELTTRKNFFIEKYLYTLLDEESKEVLPSVLPTYQNGEVLDLVSYVIDGNSYYQLAELSDLLQFDLSWDKDNKTVAINTLVLG